MSTDSIKFTGKSKAWIMSPKYFNFDDLLNLIKAGQYNQAANAVHLSQHNMETEGWVEIGTAELTVTLLPTDVMQSKQIEALQEELRQHRVKSELYEQQILSQISKLQSLELQS